MKRFLLVTLAIGLAHLGASAQILTNGDFESNWTGWTNSTTLGATATFSLDKTPANVHSGTNAAKVSVTKTGTDIKAVQLQHQSFNSSGDTVHLLTFWARTSVESAELTINIHGTSDIPCHFKLRNVWHKYLFPFKSSETSLVLNMFMHTQSDYFIDDVEILNQGSSLIDVRTLYRWHYKPQAFGLQATDNDISLLLPDGRRVWFFNDTFLGINNPYDNNLQQSFFARNAMVIESPNGVMTTVNYGTQANPHDFVVPAYPPSDGSPAPAVNLYWVGDAVIENGKVKLILIEVIDPRDGNGTRGTARRDLATFSLPDLTLESVQQMPVTGTDSYEAVVEDGNYWYLYAWISEGFSSWTKVARAAKGNLLGDVTPWEFYNNGVWTTDYTKASIVTDRGASGMVKLGPDNFAMIAMPPLSGQVQVLYAQSPVGPWTPSLLLYKVPDEPPYWNYMPNIHGDRYNNGEYTISYSTNTFESWFSNPGPFGDKYHYLPRYLHVNLAKLSPYTNTDLALHKPVTVSTTMGTNTGALAVDNNPATHWEGADSDPQWLVVDLGYKYAINRVRVTWDAAYAKNYDVQFSLDNKDWTTIKSVINNTGTVGDYFDLAASARYVRIRAMKQSGKVKGYAIASLQVYGVLDNNPNTVTGTEPVQLGETSAPYPVPFAQRVSIPVVMQETGEVQIDIYDSLGENETSITRRLPVGMHQITWEGTDTQNNTVKPGLYVIKVKTGRKVTTYKIVKQ